MYLLTSCPNMYQHFVQVVDSEEVGKVFGIVAVNGDLAIIFGNNHLC